MVRMLLSVPLLAVGQLLFVKVSLLLATWQFTAKLILGFPTELAPFLSKGKEPREYEGVKGERLRTVKLRGQLSQGLLLPFRNLVPTKMLGCHVPVTWY
jgi:hypothetical protein